MEEVCLKWGDFQTNISYSFSDVREQGDLTDVTLVSQDNQNIEAHKVIISAFSLFFRTLLKRNKHAHPLIYTRGMKSRDLVAAVNFMYKGEVNILQSDLNNFLQLAEEMEIKEIATAKDESKTLDTRHIMCP